MDVSIKGLWHDGTESVRACAKNIVGRKLYRRWGSVGGDVFPGLCPEYRRVKDYVYAA